MPMATSTAKAPISRIMVVGFMPTSLFVSVVWLIFSFLVAKLVNLVKFCAIRSADRIAAMG